jgi:hypothetical protein
MRIVRSQIWSTGTPENTETRIVWCHSKEFVYECVIREKFTGGTINEEGSCEENLVPMSMLAFGYTVLLMCVGARDVMGDANGLEKGVYFFILPSQSD